LYWEKAGRENTAATVRLALEKAEERAIRYIVVASNTGETARLFRSGDQKIVCVTHHTGFRAPGENEMEPAVRRELTENGFAVLTTTHLFANVERAVTKQFGGLNIGGIISGALRMFGQGMKVCCEISAMALDAGLIPYGEDVIAVGGSGRGADTAVIIRPAHANDFFATEIKEIICKPGSIR